MFSKRHLAALQRRYQDSFPTFFTRIFQAEVLQKIDSQRVTNGNHERAEWTWPLLLLTGLFMGWSNQRGIVHRFSEAAKAAATFTDSPLRKSYQGFMKQLRASEPAPMFRRFLHPLREKIQQAAGSAYRVGPWIPLGVDGSRVDLPRTVANEKACPRAGRKGSGPQMLVTLMMHLSTGMVWGWEQGPATTSERQHVKELAKDLPEGSLLVSDAGNVGYDFFLSLIQADQPFLIRCGNNVSLLLEEDWPVETQIKRTRQGIRVYLWPKTAQDKGKPPIVLRLIVLKKKGKDAVYLLTNVHCSQKLSKAMARKIYSLRWGLEVKYRSLKETMERRKLRSGNPSNATAELAMNIAALAVLSLHGLILWGRHVAKMSFAGALDAVRQSIAYLWAGIINNEFLPLLRKAVKDTYSRHGPKSTRRHPQKKKETPPKPPKLLIPNEEQRNLLAMSEPLPSNWLTA